MRGLFYSGFDSEDLLTKFNAMKSMSKEIVAMSGIDIIENRLSVTDLTKMMDERVWCTIRDADTTQACRIMRVVNIHLINEINAGAITNVTASTYSGVN